MTRPLLDRIRAGLVNYGALTSLEVELARDQGALLILPVGATEQHGDGLPLATDTIRADHVAGELASALAGRAFVLPHIAYGISPHHLGLPGTISLAPEDFIRLVTSVAAGVARQGFTKILVVSGHGGNMAALGVVQQSLLATHPELVFAATPVSALATEAQAAMSRTEVSGHSGESETSQVLAIDAELVDVDRLNPGATKLAELSDRARLSRTKTPSSAVPFDHYAENGVLGDPRSATVSDGQRILAEVVDRLVDYAQQMLDI